MSSLPEISLSAAACVAVSSGSFDSASWVAGVSFAAVPSWESYFAASVWTWAIIFSHALRLKAIHRRSDRYERDFWAANDIDAFHQHCLDEGAMLAVSGEPVDQAWGWREFALKDPNGYVWSIYQDKSGGQWT